LVAVVVEITLTMAELVEVLVGVELLLETQIQVEQEQLDKEA
tara:strand:- start:267 stop:392 length:126 start_codon:yes stop_codon:yes gene_type:complete